MKIIQTRQIFLSFILIWVLIGCAPPPQANQAAQQQQAQPVDDLEPVAVVPTAATTAVVEEATAAPVAAATTSNSDTIASDNNTTAQAGQPQGTRPEIDFDTAAATLGISVDQLRGTLGTPPPDFAAAAATLAISEEALMNALGLQAGAPPAGDSTEAGAAPIAAADTNTENSVVINNTTAACPSENFISVSAHPNNSAYPAPTLNVTCDENNMYISSNGIPSFEFVSITPGGLEATNHSWQITLNPQITGVQTEVPLLGTIAVAIDGLPIFGPNEGGNLGFGDPFTDNILDFCNGHTAQSTYHYHSRPDCLFANLDGQVGLVIGYALDGFPILSPYVCTDAACTSTQKMESSWQKTSNATAAWEANEYVAGSGDLDQCNGRTLNDGGYAYFATDTFPYVLGCYVGTPQNAGAPGQPSGGGQGGQGGGQGGQAQGGNQPQGGPDFAAAATTLGISEEALRAALGTGLPPDFAAASATLGISEEALRAALPPPGR